MPTILDQPIVCPIVIGRDAALATLGRWLDRVRGAADPRQLLTAIRHALNPDGIYVCLDFNSAERPEENFGPLGVLLYASSIFYCMTTSLAEGGEGLGAAGLPERKLRDLAVAAGFATVDRIPIDDPFNTLYEIRP